MKTRQAAARTFAALTAAVSIPIASSWARQGEPAGATPTAATATAPAQESGTDTSAASTAINVTINGEPVPFPGQGPVQQAGSVLVPLRGVFEKLGASVKFDATSKTITAVKGPTTVVLRLGETSATVNGEARTLTAAAQAVNGTTLVPLRFVSEALGGQVKWDAASRLVQITTGAAQAARLPGAPATGPLTGTLTGVFPETRTLTVRVAGGENTQVALAPDVIILARLGEGGQGSTVELNSLRVGDQVAVRRDSEGKANLLEVLYDERRGEVKSIEPLPDGGSRITLSDGATVDIVSGAPVTMSGNPITLSDIKPGEKIVIRINPQTKQGVGIAVGTGDNPNPLPLVKPEVTSFKISGAEEGKILREGDTLSLTVNGNAGGQATFTIPGLPNALNLPLTEASPGVYTGTFPIPAGVSLKGAAVYAQITLGELVSEAKQSAPISLDSAPPQLSDLTPAEGAALVDARPLIYGTYSDPITGVDAQTTRIMVNGQDITAQATITPAFFSYRPAADMAVGPVSVSVLTKDGAGNEAKREWAFTITPAAKPLTTVAFSPADKTLNAGDVLTVRAEALPGGVAKFSVGGVITERYMNEERPGLYTGAYTVRRGDSLTKAPVSVVFTPRDSTQSYTMTAPQMVTMAAGAPSAPIIDLPLEGGSVGNTVVISGRAAPGSTVRIAIRYQGRLLILNTGGALTTVEIKVGDNGKWESPVINLNPPTGASNLLYTAEIVAVSSSGEASATSTVRFKK